jgi:hypothetical protein
VDVILKVPSIAERYLQDCTTENQRSTLRNRLTLANQATVGIPEQDERDSGMMPNDIPG